MTKPTRPKTTSFFSIDVRKIERARKLVGSRQTFVWICPDTGNGVNITDLYQQVAQIEYTCEGTKFEFMVPITRTDCHLGGQRPWFRCPNCLKRVALLYIHGPLACRRCWRAIYPVQCEDAQLRAWRRANRIRAQLGAPLGIPAYLISKPNGMHWRKYEELVSQIADLEKRGMESTPNWLNQLDN
jgi:hypothetical protein